MTKIVARCEVGIDLHTGSDNRENLPQLRADLSDPDTRKLAEAFGAPVLLDARARDGSLRDAATRKGKKVVLYEGGQAKRFDEHAIAVGVAGIRRVLAALGMYQDAPQPGARSIELSGARWVRARRSGILRVVADLGDEVQHAQAIGEISDAFGGATVAVRAPAAGIVIGLTRLPLVHQGDAIAHIGLP
jgi:predicted deacylase